MKRWILLAALSAALVAAVACGSDEEITPTPAPIPTVAPTEAPSGAAAGLLGPGDTPAPPGGFLDTSKNYTAVFEMEKGGEIEIKLFDDLVPSIVENLINLSPDSWGRAATRRERAPEIRATSSPTSSMWTRGTRSLE